MNFAQFKMTFGILTKVSRCITLTQRCNISYIQGQSPQRRVREYFYYIDHQGMLFLDDTRIKNFTSCFKEVKFLNFFFKQLKISNGNRYPEFPFVSLCGIERNYIRCDDLPIVYTHLKTNLSETGINTTYICYGNAGDSMKEEFDPSKICMQIETGRVYYPSSKIFGGVGLVRSQLAIQLSSQFVFEDGEDSSPTHIHWNNNKIKLTQECSTSLEEINHIRKFSMGLNNV